MSPRELQLLLEADADAERARYGPSAHIQALLANMFGKSDDRDEPYRPADFMPGAPAKSEHDKLVEWATAVLEGEKFDEAPDRAELEERRRTIRKTFSNVLST